MSRWRRIILIAMLASLGLAAAAGVLSVLVTARTLMWRVTGTGITTAVAALLLLPLSLLADHARWQRCGLAAMGTVVVLYGLVLGMIWDISRILPGSWDEEELLTTALAVVLAGFAAATFLRLLDLPASRIAAVTGLVLAGAFFVVAMAGTWLPQPWGGVRWYAVRERLWMSAAWIGGMGLLAVLALVGLGDRRHWRWAGVAATALAVLLGLVDLWRIANVSPELAAPVVAAACFVAFANLLDRLPLTGAQGWLKTAALAAGAATAACAAAIAYQPDEEMLQRLTAAGGILTGCASLAIVVMGRLNRRVHVEAVPADITRITLQCPGCGRRITTEPGVLACPGCGLGLEVKAFVPHCHQCGYSLYRISSAVCPECGAPRVLTPPGS